MNRATLLLLGVVSILGVAACSSDSSLSVTSSKQSSGAAGASASASTDSSDSGTGTGTDSSDSTDSALSVPDVGSIPGISKECTTYLTAIASAFTPNAEGGAQLADSFDALEQQVPDNLKDDVRVLRDGFTKLQKLYAKYDNDYSKIVTDPEAAALFSDQSFAEASANVSAWLESECPSS